EDPDLILIVPELELILPVVLLFRSVEWERGFVPAGVPTLKSARV
ncbi:hypothetical protein A2U01_0093532, partial [Trifolium medium]|nr:hypothetical protein [Trifolium medium]